MTIDSKDYCDNVKCPLHTETDMEFIRLSSTYIKVTVADGQDITVAVPCLLCSHAKKIDMGHIMSKIATKQMLTRGDFRTSGLRDNVINADTNIE